MAKMEGGGEREGESEKVLVGCVIHREGAVVQGWCA